jgi:tetratricopeptide (TPR) repeat protein
MTILEEEIIDKVLAFQNKNWHKRALKLLHEVEAKEKTIIMVYGLMGSSYYQIEDFRNSAKYFKKCLKIKPTSELASLDLFHSNLENKRYKDAFIELKRYLGSNKPKLYKILIKELMETTAFCKYYP